MIRVLLLVGIMMALVGATLYEQGKTQKELDDILINVSYDQFNFTFEDKARDINLTFTERAIYKFADFAGFVVVEGLRESIEFGYDNPKYNFDLAWKLLFISIFAVLIVPLIYVITFLGYFGIMLWGYIKKTYERLSKDGNK